MRYLVIIFVIIVICEIWYASGAKRRRRTLRREAKAKGFRLKKCDGCSKLVNLQVPFTVRNVTYRYAHVSTNGYIVLWPNHPGHVTLPRLPPETRLSVPLLAAFWTNITTNIRSRVFPKVVTYKGRTVPFHADYHIRKKFRSKYVTKKSFTVKWINVVYAGGSRRTKRNTFELVLTTDFKMTFVVFYYKSLHWSRPRRRGAHAMAGIDFGDKTNTMLPGSRTASVVRLRRKSNIRRTKITIKRRLGTFVYRVDTSKIFVRDISGQTSAQKKCVAGRFELSPKRASLLGGSPITVSGPCFKRKAYCRFDKVVVRGYVVSRNKAVCVTPVFSRVGVIPVSVSVKRQAKWSPPVELTLDAGDVTDSLSVPRGRSSGHTWGDLVTPLGNITWPRSHFRTRVVRVVYKMLTNSDKREFISITLKKTIRNRGSLNLDEINLKSISTLHSGFVGALGIKEVHSRSSKTRFGAPVTMWTLVHPARWYYNMYVKELIRRARLNTTAVSKSNYVRAAEAVMGAAIWTQRISNEDLLKRFTQKSADINKIFFKVKPSSNN